MIGLTNFPSGKKLKLVFAVLFMLISPIFGLRHFLLKRAWRGINQLANAENWAVINGYA